MPSRNMDQRCGLHPSVHSTQRILLHPQRRLVPSEQGRVRDGSGAHALHHLGGRALQRGAMGRGITDVVTGD